MKLNTTKPRQFIKKILQKIRLRYLARQDIARFSRTAPLSMFDGLYEQVTSRIMYNVHALEKGLARNRDLRLGFGRKALSHLNDALVVYRSNNYDETAFPYVEGMSIIRRYVELHTAALASDDIDFLADV
ncbi:MAG TPA: hypothetical protein VGC11_05230, partial [Acidimicrobiia bacterium]